MARPLSPERLRRDAIAAMRAALVLAQRAEDYGAMHAIALRMDQAASRLAKDLDKRQSMMAPSLTPASSPSPQGLTIGRAPR